MHVYINMSTYISMHTSTTSVRFTGIAINNNTRAFLFQNNISNISTCQVLYAAEVMLEICNGHTCLIMDGNNSHTLFME